MRLDMTLRQYQSGLGLISVIFMITVGALLAAGMASFAQLGQQHMVQGFHSTRAMQAAESGIQLALNRLIHPQSPGGCSAATSSSSPVATPYSFSAAGVMGCSAIATCTVTTIDSIDYVKIVSVGRCGGTAASLETASRRIQVRAIRP